VCYGIERRKEKSFSPITLQKAATGHGRTRGEDVVVLNVSRIGVKS
jgi:hypothetical protein